MHKLLLSVVMRAALVAVAAQCVAAFAGPDLDGLHSIGSDSNQFRWSPKPVVVTAITNPPGGIGVVIGPTPRGAVIERVVAWTPAWLKGLQAGDVIVEVDARPTVGVPLREIALRLRGDVGSEVNLTLARRGHAEPLKVKLRREVVTPPRIPFVSEAPNNSTEPTQPSRCGQSQFPHEPRLASAIPVGHYA